MCSIVDYGGEIFGRAARSFLGVNKTTPIVGVISEINLLLPQYRTQLKMVRQYHRVLKCSANIVSKKVFFWDKKLNGENRVKSWYSEVRTIFTENEMQDIFESGNLFSLKDVINKLHSSMLKKQQFQIKTQCLNTPKLRTFVEFKDFFSTQKFLTKPLSFIQRKFLAKIRLGCLELRIETHRYACPRLTPESVMSKFYFLFECKVYEEERFLWLRVTNMFNISKCSQTSIY